MAEKIVKLTKEQKYVLEAPERTYNAPLRFILETEYSGQSPVKDNNQADIALKICYQQEDCSRNLTEEGKREIPPQIKQKIDYSLFSKKTKKKIQYKDFYIYVFQKK